MINDENDCSSENINAQVEGRITTRWRRPGMQREKQEQMYDGEKYYAGDGSCPRRLSSRPLYADLQNIILGDL